MKAAGEIMTALAIHLLIPLAGLLWIFIHYKTSGGNHASGKTAG
jgi:hypothetical protein